eukprot:7337189-Ditylum_brightwellii.AAC.1
MKCYLQPQNARGTINISVLDVDEIRTGAMKAISHYKAEQDKTKIIVVKKMFYTMMEFTNSLEKIPPHKRVVLKEEMERHLQTHHNQHFRQAEKMPFTKEPLKSLIGYCADTKFAKELQEGTTDIENRNTDEYTKDFLHGIKAHPADPPKARRELSYSDNKEGFKIWNEKT